MPLIRLISVLITIIVLLTACETDNDDTKYTEKPVEDLYHEAMNAMDQGNYFEAAQSFDTVERQHPYSVWATKAKLMSAYAHYQDNAYDEAIAALDRFISLHPGNKDVAYAYYLKGLSYYERISDVVRDQGVTEESLEIFEELVRRFPGSKYARDAQLKIDVAIDQLGGQEMHIGRYYQKKGEYLAAINRYRTVIEKYQTTIHTPEALHRLVESYLSLGVVKEAQVAAAVLGHNFPDSYWYQDSFRMLKRANLEPTQPGLKNVNTDADEESWLDALWNALF